MTDSDKPLRDLANAAGFLFQIRVGQEIEKRYSPNLSGSLRIKYREHRVVDPLTNEEVFVDYVVQSERLVFVVECKRVADGRWLFLVPDGKREIARSQLLWSSNGGPSLIGWDEFGLFPATPEAAFCITDRKQQNRDANLLESIAGNLTRSAEALALEQIDSDDTLTLWRHDFVYVPLIITNASLTMCEFDPSTVDIHAGELPPGTGTFTPCSVIRFRKSLSTALPLKRSTRRLVEFPRRLVSYGDPEDTRNERTVLIMHVDAFDPVWSNWGVRPHDSDGFPWTLIRAAQRNMPASTD